MMNHLRDKFKELLKNIWEDFKNPVYHKTESKHCCSATAFHSEEDIRSELIRVIQQQNNINSKNTYS